MNIGVPKEIKPGEHRVALTPSGVRTLVAAGHTVLVETSAGIGARMSDTEYLAAGATIGTAEQAWAADMVVKVKEPIPSEYRFLRENLILFTYLHMAADRQLTDAILAAGTDSIAYENVTERDQSLPLLAPMSEIAGRLATQVGAEALLQHNGGRGVLLGGVPGTEVAEVVVIGAGVAGTQAAVMAIGLGARVTVMDINVTRLRQIGFNWGGQVQTLVSTDEAIKHAVATASLVIGTVLVPGAKAPHVLSTETIMTMMEGSVLVDVAIDQGGCFEPSRPTTHQNPTFKVGPAVLYCVANMPGAVPRTSTLALTNATLPYAVTLANKGFHKALKDDPRLAAGLNTSKGKLYLPGIAEAHGLVCANRADLLG